MALARRALLLAAGAAALAAATGRAQQSWPSQPLKLVVPYPPGGLTDVLGRLAGERLQKAFGQPVVIDNKAGAGTQLGAAFVAKAPADGTTLLLATVTTLSITPALYLKPMTSPSDFTGVAMLGNVTLILVCRADLAARDPKELVALLKQKPDALTFGSPGIGSAHHLLVELMRQREDFRAVHVPYLGSAKAMVDLAEGRFDFMFLDATVALPQIASGKIRALAVTGGRRTAIVPGVPALTEFFPGIDLVAWQSIVAPAQTPAPIVARLNDVLNKALGEPAFVQRLREIGLEPMPLTVAAFNDFIQRDAQRWAELVKESGAKVE